MGERKVYRVLMGKPEEKRPLGRQRRIWEDGTRMELRKIGWVVWSGVDAVGSGYGPVGGS
jgi:hypothetical protein